MAVRATQNLGPHVHSESEQLFAGKLASKYVLRLYVAGRGVFSARAMGNIKRLCDTILRGRCELQIIDLYQQPTLAKRDHVVTVPTLVKLYPPPVVTLIGDMSNTEQVFRGLGIVLENSKEEMSREEEEHRS